jgi:periplasmic divalent cation tolerance protein
MGYVVVLITAPVEKAPEIATFLVEKKLAACVNVIEQVHSTYWWMGKIENDTEGLLIAKTKSELFKKLMEEVKKVHPYGVPEIIALPIADGNENYLRWIDESLKGEEA